MKMWQRADLISWNYAVVNDHCMLVNNQLPEGPMKLLLDGCRVEMLYNDYGENIVIRPGCRADGLLRVCYFSPVPWGEQWRLMSLIPLFNNAEAEITVYHYEECPAGLMAQACNHVRFVRIEHLSHSRVVEADIVMTCYLSAVYFLQQRIPVIVAGPYGFGGSVRPENFEYFSRDGFGGRPGGYLWEPLPTWSLQAELKYIRQEAHMDDLLEQNRSLACALPYTPYKDRDALIRKWKRYYEQVHMEQERWTLKPVLGKVAFTQHNGMVTIRGTIFNNFIGYMEDLSFFSFVDGERSFRDLHDMVEMDEVDFWELIYQLLDRKIIAI